MNIISCYSNFLSTKSDGSRDTKNENFSTLYAINIASVDEFEEAKSILENLNAEREANMIYISEKETWNSKFEGQDGQQKLQNGQLPPLQQQQQQQQQQQHLNYQQQQISTSISSYMWMPYYLSSSLIKVAM